MDDKVKKLQTIAAAGKGGKRAMVNTAVELLLISVGVPPEVASRIAPYVVTYVLILMGFLSLLGIALLALLLTGGGKASDSEKYLAIDMPLRRTVETAADKWHVPSKVLIGIAAVQTDLGRTSPYDTVDRVQPADGVTASRFPVVSPAIGDSDMRGEGLGPYLIQAGTVKSEGLDPQSWKQSSELVAKLLRKSADKLVRAGLVEPTNVEDADRFWAQAVNDLPLVDPVTGAAGCSADPADVGKAIQKIWACEIRLSGALVTEVQVLPGGVVRTYTLSAGDSKARLVNEALGVAWVWAGSRGVPADWATIGARSCSNATTFAGVFPITQAQAKAFGSEDRCDVINNIRVAARAVTTDLAVQPLADSSAPFAPALHGWRVLPWVLGNSENVSEFSAEGPWVEYSPAAACEALAQTWLASLGASTNATTFGKLSTGLATSEEIEAAWAAIDDRDFGAHRTDERCVELTSGRAPNLRRYVSWLAGVAVAVIDVAGEASVAKDPNAYKALTGVLELEKRKGELRIAADPPETSAIPRLSTDQIAVDYPFVQPDPASTAGLGERAVGAAISFGGIVPGDDRSGTDPTMGGLGGGSVGGIGISFVREDPAQKPVQLNTTQLIALSCGTDGTARFAIPAVATRWEILCEAAAGDGVPLHINSAWRSAASQAALYSSNGSSTVAAPGTSPHEKGAALDVDLGTSWGSGGDAGRQFAWLHSVVGCYATSSKSYQALASPVTSSEFSLRPQTCGSGSLPVKRAQTYGMTPLCLNHYNNIEHWDEEAVIVCRKEPMKSSPTGFSREPWHFDIGIIVATVSPSVATGTNCLSGVDVDPSSPQSVAIAVKAIWLCKLSAAGLDNQPPRDAGRYQASGWAKSYADQIASEAVVVGYCESGLKPTAVTKDGLHRGVFQMGDAELKAQGVDPALWADAKRNIGAAADYWLSTYRVAQPLEGWRPWAVVNTQWFSKANPAKFPVIGRFAAVPPSPEAGVASGLDLPRWAIDPQSNWGPTAGCSNTLASGKPLS